MGNSLHIIKEENQSPNNEINPDSTTNAFFADEKSQNSADIEKEL